VSQDYILLSQEFNNIKELPSFEYRLLQKRTRYNAEFGESSSICTHHQKLYLAKFKDLQRKCCDPFSVHTKPVRSKLFSTDMDTAKSLSAACCFDIIPGWKLCSHCLSNAKALHEVPVEEPSTSANHDSDDPDFSAHAMECANRSLQEIECSPFKFAQVQTDRRISYTKRKLEATAT